MLLSKKALGKSKSPGKCATLLKRSGTTRKLVWMTVNFKSFAVSTIAKRIVLTISTDKFKYSIRLF